MSESLRKKESIFWKRSKLENYGIVDNKGISLIMKIKSIFGIDCTACDIRISQLPLYMTAGRTMTKVDYGEDSFVIVGLSQDDRFGVIALEKQLRIYEDKCGMNVAYSVGKLSKVQRNALIARRIPFISIPDQIYLPFLGMAIRNRFKKESTVSAEKMMPATQALFLYLLYQKADYVVKKKAAEKLHFTKTSITRASEQLKKMGLITEISKGKEVQMIPSLTGREFFQRAEQYLINPVQKTIFIENAKDFSCLCRAGESALSEHSMLGEPKFKVYAIYKNAEIVSEMKECDPRWEDNGDICQVELWKYDPLLFTEHGSIDPVSLAMSLKQNEDERVQGELEDYLEEYEW